MHNIMVVSPLDHHPNRSKSFLIPVVPTCGFPKSDVLIVGIPTLGHQKRNTIISNRHRIKRMGKILKSCMGPVVFRDTLVKMMVCGYQFEDETSFFCLTLTHHLYFLAFFLYYDFSNTLLPLHDFNQNLQHKQ